MTEEIQEKEIRNHRLSVCIFEGGKLAKKSQSSYLFFTVKDPSFSHHGWLGIKNQLSIPHSIGLLHCWSTVRLLNRWHGAIEISIYYYYYYYLMIEFAGAQLKEFGPYGLKEECREFWHGWLILQAPSWRSFVRTAWRMSAGSSHTAFLAASCTSERSYRNTQTVGVVYTLGLRPFLTPCLPWNELKIN